MLHHLPFPYLRLYPNQLVVSDREIVSAPDGVIVFLLKFRAAQVSPPHFRDPVAFASRPNFLDRSGPYKLGDDARRHRPRSAIRMDTVANEVPLGVGSEFLKYAASGRGHVPSAMSSVRAILRRATRRTHYELHFPKRPTSLTIARVPSSRDLANLIARSGRNSFGPLAFIIAAIEANGGQQIAVAHLVAAALAGRIGIHASGAKNPDNADDTVV
jgi:hypothetical protein